MEPRIQYAKTEDGVSIAFYTMGKGKAFVQLPRIPVSFIAGEFQIPGARSWTEHLAQSRTYVSYDCRGSGLSDRNPTDSSLDGHVLDLEAVTNNLGLEDFDIFAPGGTAGQVAITFAVRHTERVSNLILWEAYARAHEILNRPQFRALASMIDTDWEIATEAMAIGLVQGWSDADGARVIAALVRENISPDQAKASLSSMREWDVTELLPQVRSATLVLHQRDYTFLESDDVKVLAAEIPQARLALLEGSGLNWTGHNLEAVLAEIDGFLSEDEEATAASEAPGPARSEPSSSRTCRAQRR